MKWRNTLFFFVTLLPLAGAAQSYVPEFKDSRFAVKSGTPIHAYAFDLKDVQVTAGPFAHARAMDSTYLLSLQPDRLLHRFHTNAGLPAKDSVYGGWESEGLSGHTLGHYLSACAMMYASTGNDAFRKRVNYIVSELHRCQEARGTGYVGAIPGEDTLFARVARGDIHSGGFDLNGGWSPWYTVHKVMAGLVDAFLYAGNKEAMKVVTGMADWTYGIVFHLPDSLRLKMLNCEYGGMNEVLADIYAITGNKKYLDLSYKFYDEFVMGKLAEQVDPMPGKHSNTNVPKAIGSARQYELTGNSRDSTIAAFFWSAMVHHHSYVIGGNSNYEYCGQPDALNDRLSDNTCETCNTYNMLKLTRHLFAWSPSATLMDYYERALYNHILASQNPENGMMTYFVPLRMGTKKEFSTPFTTFTCCVGSGMENHSKYAEQIYGTDGHDDLYVNLFIPSVLQWKSKKTQVEQLSFVPESDHARIRVTCPPGTRFTMKIRKPSWTAGSPVLMVNGKEIPVVLGPDGYLVINRTWNPGDLVDLHLPMNLYTEAMPDNPDRIAIKYGPLVLAGRLGEKRPDPVFGTPVLMTDDRNVQDWIQPVAGKPLHFRMENTGQPFDPELVPFYQVYDQYYSVYWDFFTPEDWARRQAEYEAEKRRQEDIGARTVDDFRIGEMQPERDHHLAASERSYVSDALGRMGREARAGHYFSFDMRVDPGVPQSLLLTYIGDDKDRVFDVLVDGTRLATVEWKGGATGRFYDVEYPLPAALLGGKQTITIRVEANYGKTAGRVFHARILKANQQ